MAKTKRMSVEYYVVKVVHYGGEALLDVPVNKLDENGAIDIDWVRMNYPHETLDVADEDIMEERLGGEEYAYASLPEQPKDP